MLMVKTKISESAIHGTGLFAEQDISEGQVIWKFKKSTCDVYSFEHFLRKCSELTLDSVKELMHYSYIKDNKIFHILNEAKFINHSPDPNICFLDWKTEVALRDIKKGEELLENYHKSYDGNDFFTCPDLFQILCKDSLVRELGKYNANSPVLHRSI